MGKSLFIAEKPSVAMEFAKALGASGRKDGYIEDNNNIITWCVGHLIEMCLPDEYSPEMKEWSLDTLPFIPNKFKYKVISSVNKQYKIVAQLLNRKDVSKIYYSGDSAREGEYIQRLVREKAGHNPSAQEFRVWIDSQTEEEIKKGIREAKPLSAYDSLSDSGYARAIEDYLVGMNFSRALSIKYGRLVNAAINAGKYRPVAVGRVMSCVLGMIVQREREIRSADIFPFYGIKADMEDGITLSWKSDAGRFSGTPAEYNGSGLKEKDPVDALAAELNSTGSIKIISVEKSKSKKSAPLLFNLAELQGECTKLFHISPSETLAIAQALYEAKLTTYPRTDARVLTTAMLKVWDHNISGLKSVPEIGRFADEVLSTGLSSALKSKPGKYVDDSKVSDHYAIIPTGEGMEALNSLSEMQKKVYLLICRRFLSIFYPAAEISKVQVAGEACGEKFTGSVSAVTDEGWMMVAGHKDDSAEKQIMAAMGSLGEGVSAPCSYSVKEGKSQPPKRYTTGSMILAMENAGNLIDDPELREEIKGSGIGTSATRSDTIEKLSKDGYISVNKKTQVIQPAAFGELIYEVLARAVPQILNPKYTASWESGLRGIVEGRVTKDVYLGKIYGYIQGGVSAMKSGDHTEELKVAMNALREVYPELGDVSAAGGSKESGLTCPLCGKMLMNGSKGLYCSGYKEGCKFSIFSTMAKKRLPDEILKELVSSFRPDGTGGGEAGPTAKVNGFKSKAGKSFNAKLVLKMDPGDYPKLSFVFDEKK